MTLEGYTDYYYYSLDDDDDDDAEIEEFKRKNEANRKAREKAKKEFEQDIEAAITSDARQIARKATDTVLNEYDEVRQRAWSRDQQTLEYIDEILRNAERSPFYVPSAQLNTRRGSYNRYNVVRNDDRLNKPTTDDIVSKSQMDTVCPINGKIRDSSSKETARQKMKRVEERLEGILDYELPSADNFKNMRHSLREINDKMSKHRLILDRHNSTDLEDENDGYKVSERINEKYKELEERMPCLTMSDRQREKVKRTTRFDPCFIPGYSTGLSITNSEQNAELRSRIKSLLLRTKRNG
uniref:Uncharacterized protein n=2 Tax=Schistosoma japonicum TaxID=6182 RepID=C1LD81_SCHJA|nr:hypothetical protein [Schistosoma japonicum]